MAFTPWVREKVELLQHYHRISEVGEIVRRYFALNAFDGVLTTLGVLVGAYLGGVESRATVVTVVLTTAVGMSVSGFYGSYLVEKAERDRALRDLEESTLSSLKNTDIASASRYATVLIAVVDGASPFVAAMICLIPFAISSLATDAAYFAAMAVAFVETFLLGVFLGIVSRQHWVYAGLRFTGAAVIALVISFLLEGRIGP